MTLKDVIIECGKYLKNYLMLEDAAYDRMAEYFGKNLSKAEEEHPNEIWVLTCKKGVVEELYVIDEGTAIATIHSLRCTRPRTYGMWYDLRIPPIEIEMTLQNSS